MVQADVNDDMKPLMSRVAAMTDKFEAAVNTVKDAADQELHDFLARRLYEMAAVSIMSALLVTDASKAPELFADSAKVYLNIAEAEVEKHSAFISKFNANDLASYRK